jgi:hypothetical protein
MIYVNEINIVIVNRDGIGNLLIISNDWMTQNVKKKKK